MVPRSTPASRIQTKSVEPDSASGNPEEKPSSSTISPRRCRYTVALSRQEGAGGSGSTDLDAASGVTMRLVGSRFGCRKNPSSPRLDRLGRRVGKSAIGRAHRLSEIRGWHTDACPPTLRFLRSGFDRWKD